MLAKGISKVLLYHNMNGTVPVGAIVNIHYDYRKQVYELSYSEKGTDKGIWIYRSMNKNADAPYSFTLEQVNQVLDSILTTKLFKVVSE